MPSALRAQSQVRRIGYITTGKPGDVSTKVFLGALRDAGFAEGRDVLVEARFAAGRQELIPEMVAELVGQRVDILVTVSTVTALAAKNATTTIPIVFASVFDPIAAGLVPRLGHPGGNITGSAMGVGEGFASKWLELLKEADPRITRVAVIWNSKNRSSAQAAEELREVSKTLSVGVEMIDTEGDFGLDKSLSSIRSARVQGVVVTPDPSFNANRRKLVQLMARARLPAIYFFTAFVNDGGLMSYGAIHADTFRTAAAYVARILRGAKPSELPVEQPNRYELVVNQRTAKSLGLVLPQSLTLRADRIVD